MGRLQTHRPTHTSTSLETMQAPPRRGTAGVVPTIRMLSGLPDVVLTHVHGPPGRGGACSTACDTGNAGSERRGTKGDANKRDRGGRGSESRVSSFFSFFFLSSCYLAEDDISPRDSTRLPLDGRAGGLPRDGNLEDDRKRVGDGLNKRDTRRDGL